MKTQRMRWVVILLLMPCLVAIAAEGRASEKRVALVIGNNAYRHFSPLEKAVKDAEAVGKELQGLGFDVILRTDAKRKDMHRAVEEFIGQLSGGDVAMLFYAGHGVQLGGTNYLLPTDLEAEQESDVVNDGLELSGILNRVAQTKAKFSMAIIDACRNNPFRKSGRAIGATRGLATLSAPNGLMVIYSAGANEEALDRLNNKDQDPNGLFTREFLKAIRVSGLRIDDIVKSVRAEVKKKASSVGHQQNPALYDQTDGDFYFRIEGVVKKGTSNETVFWQSIQGSKNPEEYKAYLQQFPKGVFALLARSRMDEFKGKPTVLAGGVPENDGESQRLEAERKAIEAERRKLEEEKRARDEADRKAHEAEERKRLEAERKAIEAERLQLEAERKVHEGNQVLGGKGEPSLGDTWKDPASEMEFMWVPKGNFQMGSPEDEEGRSSDEKQHLVSVQGFWMGKYEVTNAQYRQFKPDHDSKDFKGNTLNGEEQPVVSVDWNEATAYAEWLSGKGNGQFRLPTEAEWEYAARAKTETARYWGDQGACNFGNVLNPSVKSEFGFGGAEFPCEDGYKVTAPITEGKFRANVFGLHHMLGNVWEWTCSAYADPYDGEEKKCAKKGSNRVRRGGGWYFAPAYVRAAYRNADDPGDRYGSLGFRLTRQP